MNWRVLYINWQLRTTQQKMRQPAPMKDGTHTDQVVCEATMPSDPFDNYFLTFRNRRWSPALEKDRQIVKQDTAKRFERKREMKRVAVPGLKVKENLAEPVMIRRITQGHE